MNQPVKLSKGEATRQRILSAARDLIDEAGIALLSQEAAARRAGISQSTLRHHFATKDALIDAIFDANFTSYFDYGNVILLDPALSVRERLLRLLTTHIDYALQRSDRFALESFIFATRNPGLQARRDRWYQWRSDQIAALLQQLRPALSASQCAERATALLTLSLGTWIRFGRSMVTPAEAASGRTALVNTATLIIDA